jgi:HPt (histidine-containing phosphotransfer) domain-containing protein
MTGPIDGEPIYSAFRDDPDFQELLVDFVQSARERTTTLSDAFQQGALDTVRTQAHQLKGAGGGYGYDDLSLVAADLEQACKAETPQIDEIGRCLNVLLDHLQRVSV